MDECARSILDVALIGNIGAWLPMLSSAPTPWP
jgi:hypothetical protein